MEVVKFYVINLKHRTDRKETAIKHLEDAGISNYEFIEAIHHTEFSDEYFEDMLNREYKFKTKRVVGQRGLLACGASHIKAMKKALEDFGTDGSKAIVIFEDDFHINDAETFLTELQKGLETAPPDWEFMFLGGMGKENIDKTEPFLPGLEKAKSVWGGHAYVIKNSNSIVDRVIDCYDRGYFADRAFRKIIRDDKQNLHKYLIYKPFLAVQWRSYSDIDEKIFSQSNVENKFTE